MNYTFSKRKISKMLIFNINIFWTISSKFYEDVSKNKTVKQHIKQ